MRLINVCGVSVRLAIVVISIFCTVDLHSQLISFGDSWNFYDSGMAPANDAQGDNWKSIDFDDASWPMGNAEFGYGDSDESTIITNPIMAAYFRKVVTISDPSLISQLSIDALYDDGIVVYINGIEVCRINMPSGSINYSTPAVISSGDNAQISKIIQSNLVTGDNIIAVEVHNVSMSSSDLSFDLAMDVNLQAGNFLINDGSLWKYYDLENQPSDQGVNTWKDTPYDDNTWSSGLGQLGYGDGDESTVINGNTQTVYFRHTFNVDNANIYKDLNLNLTYDDGAIVYLNGSEIWRVNMPAGPISYATFSSSNSGDNATLSKIVSSTLIDGNNTIAVEIHQRAGGSTDISFDLNVSVTIKDVVNIFDFGSSWAYFDNAMEPIPQGGVTWNKVAFDDATWDIGNAELGFGDGDENTVLNLATHTAYFRKTFQISNANYYDNLMLDMHLDDGAIVYINNVEVWRQNMPLGTPNYLMNASSAKENAQVSTMIANILQDGENVIAVEVHQESLIGDDLSFDLELKGLTKDEMPLINFEEEWSYFDNETEPPLMGSIVWSNYLYTIDGTWDSGFAQLGYGDSDEATVINDQTETAYFRKEFTVIAPSYFSGLRATLLYDDGAIVYLNGTEVMRVNMPSGTVNYNTVASSTATDNSLTTETFDNLLVSGLNNIAIEIHQRSTTSTDISFDFELIGMIGDSDATIIRGPYLQSGGHDRMTIKWRTDVATESIIDFGLANNSLSTNYSSLSKVTEHEVELIGLSPSTIYYYQISDNSIVLKPATSDVYFKTHPTPGSNASLTAWILGDCGTGNSNARAVRDAYYNYIGSSHTDMMLFLGDNAYSDGTDTEYQSALFENMYEDKLQNSVAWSCLGNHDGHSANSSAQTGPYYDIFTFPTSGESGGMASGTEAYYSFDYGDVHFIVLDSYDSDRSVGGSMYNWCLNDIQNTTSKWIIAFWHHPPYTKGSHNSDSESALIDMRERFLPILEENGVDLVLSGHSHSYERSYYLNGHYGDSDSFDDEAHTVGSQGFGDGRPDGNGAYRKPIQGSKEGDGAVYITTGSAGKTSAGSLDHEAMFYSVSSLGSCVLEISGDSLNLKFLRNTGIVEDSFTIVKCKGFQMVTTDANDGIGSLRQRVADACPLDTIFIDNSIVNPLILLSEINLDKELIIKGTVLNSTISGNGSHRIFNIYPAIPVELINLNLIDANENMDGGALLNNGILTLKNIQLHNNLEGGNQKALTNKGSIIIKSNSTTTILE